MLTTLEYRSTANRYFHQSLHGLVDKVLGNIQNPEFWGSMPSQGEVFFRPYFQRNMIVSFSFGFNHSLKQNKKLKYQIFFEKKDKKNFSLTGD